MLTLSANLKQALAQSGAKPIVLARLYHSALAWIEVSANNTDITSIGFTFYSSGGAGIANYTITAGVDFTIGGSAAATASNIANAINDLDYTVRAVVIGTQIAIVARRTYYTSSGGVRSTTQYRITHFSVSLNGADLRKILQTARNTSLPYYPHLTLVSGDKPYKRYPASILSVSAYGREIDPSTREHSAGTIQLEVVDDGLIRKLVSTVGLDNAYADIYLGEQSVAETDFMRLLRTTINGVTPSYDEPILTIELGDPLEFVRSRLYSGGPGPHHPIRMIDHILYHTNWNATYGDLFDNSTISINNVQQAASAIAVSRYRYTLDADNQVDANITEQTPILDLLNELILLLDGTLTNDDTGRLYYKNLDYAASPVRTLNVGRGAKQDAVITEMTAPYESIVNRVNVNVSGGPITGTFSIEDPASYAEYAEYFDLDISSPWLSGVTTYAPASADAARSSSFVNAIELYYYGFKVSVSAWPAGISGFDGWTTDGPSSCLQSDGQYAVNNASDRPAYFLFQGRLSTTYGGGNYVEGGQSIVKVYRTSFDPAGLPIQLTGSVEYPAITRHPKQCWAAPQQMLFKSSDVTGDSFTRGTGGFGTYPLDAAGGGVFYSFDRLSPIYVCDVTAPVWLAFRKFRRFRFGCPKITVEAPLTQADLVVGDVVSLSGDERYLTLGRDGVSSNATWEVVRSEITFVGDSPGVSLQLMLLSDSVLPTYDAVYDTTVMQQSRLTSAIARYIIRSDGSRVGIDLDGDGFNETDLTMRT